MAEAGRQALRQRYRLLPYLYSTMRAAHDTGAPAMRPLWMEFPEDAATHRNDRQFMFGDALLVTPVLTEGARSVEGHFPPGLWYSLWNASDVVHAGCVVWHGVRVGVGGWGGRRTGWLDGAICPPHLCPVWVRFRLRAAG